jgi:hypothetical protein
MWSQLFSSLFQASTPTNQVDNRDWIWDAGNSRWGSDLDQDRITKWLMLQNWGITIDPAETIVGGTIAFSFRYEGERKEITLRQVNLARVSAYLLMRLCLLGRSSSHQTWGNRNHDDPSRGRLADCTMCFSL